MTDQNYRLIECATAHAANNFYGDRTATAHWEAATSALAAQLPNGYAIAERAYDAEILRLKDEEGES